MSTRGKEKSRANSLKHGLTAKVIRTAEEVETLGEPTPRPPGKLGSSPLDADWIRGEIELLAQRVGRAGLMELRLRERSAFRAEKCWEIDQRLDVERLALKIRKHPAEVSASLEQSPEGCLWKIERWAMLANAADRENAWSEMALDTAFDLLGMPLELRTGPIDQQVNLLGQVVAFDNDLAAFARQNIGRLLEVKEQLAQADEFDQDTAKEGLLADLGDAGRRLIRYEAELQRRLKWYHDLLESMSMSQPESTPLEDPTPEPTPAGSEPAEGPTPTTEPSPTPSRKEQRIDRADRRRKAAERKLDQLLN